MALGLMAIKPASALKMLILPPVPVVNPAVDSCRQYRTTWLRSFSKSMVVSLSHVKHRCGQKPLVQ